MRIGFKEARRSFFRIYWKVVLALYAVEFSLLFLWNAGLLGGCHFNGSAMEQCVLFGMNIDGLADAFLSLWMIPLIGIVFGLVTPLFAALWPSFLIWVVTFFFYLRKVQDLPEDTAGTPSVQRAKD